MSLAFEKLSKVLKLEQSQGHHNRAVIGGFEAFAPVWRNEARSEFGSEAFVDLVDQIAAQLSSYGAADHHRRVEIVSSLLHIVGQDAEAPDAEAVPPGVSPATEPDLPLTQAPLPSPPRAPRRSRVGREQQDSTPAEPPSRPLHRPGPGLSAPVSVLPGIKTGYAERLERLGIVTVKDLLYHFPHRYDDYSKLRPINRLQYGEETTIIGVIWETTTRETRGGGTLTQSIIADASGTIQATWFNQPYLARQLRAGRRIVLSGKVVERLGRLTLQSPTWEPLEGELIHTGRLVPVYPLTQGVSARWLRSQLKHVVDHWAPQLEDHLPPSVQQRANLVDLGTALRQIHFPDSTQHAEQARRRLAFDEFLFIQLGMLRHRHQRQGQPSAPVQLDPALLDAFLQSLPFQLTGAQRRSLDEVLHDLAQTHPMGRLLQGDVGSGKTVVAAAALLAVVASGRQAALMVPTEILAEQHYRTLSDLLASRDWGLGRPVSVVLLTGSTSRSERAKIHSALASGEADIIVGTHALIQRNITFSDLAFVVVDEQHRFGVVQRAALRSKGQSPHVLVMSATPIPRSLALTIYGDLEVSVVDELPPSRQPIETRWLLPRERERAYAFIRSQIVKGHQAFILYPLIEESDRLQVRAAVEEYERLQAEVFPDLRLGLLHGRMKGSEKDAVMAAFHRGDLDLLVSTSVIEVGIDIPNATVMLIEGADRFGLAQLHQFRGRVGRGAAKSYCLLLSDSVSPDDPQTRTTWERLTAIEGVQDGFVLAEKDLEMRGPGDFLGVRQSGLPSLRLASLSNLSTLEQAREEAETIYQQDPGLQCPEHALLALQVAGFWDGQGDPS